jgi:putative hemolysin
VPDVGDTVDAGTHELVVTEMDGNRVARVRVTAVEGAREDDPVG